MTRAARLLAVLALCAAHGQPPRPPHHPHHPGRPQNSLCALHSVTPVSCASAPKPHTLVPHPDDCRLFYYCRQPHLRPLCRQCPANKHFSPIRLVCGWPAQAGCSLTSTTTSATGTTITEVTITFSEGTTTFTESTTTSTESTTTSTQGITTST